MHIQERDEEKSQDLDFIWTGDGEEEIYTHLLHDHYGIDIKFHFDRRWGLREKCPNPLSEKCVKDLIEESVRQGVKVHNGVKYVMQLLGNDFYLFKCRVFIYLYRRHEKVIWKILKKYLNGAEMRVQICHFVRIL